MPSRPEKQREYVRKHYENNKDYYVAKAAKRTVVLREFIADSKAGKPCMDCGAVYPHYVMDYDHRPGEEKIAHVGNLASRGSLAKLQAEIAKCDLICSNCHRVRTWQRAHVA